MSLNRRQFFVLGGASLGFGASLAARWGAGPSTSIAQPPVLATAPRGWSAPPRGDVRLVVISDLNSRYGSTQYIREVRDTIPLLADWQPDLVVCAGDMVAGQSLALSRSQLQAMWRAFDQSIFQPIRRAGLPFAFTLGNHDASSYRNRQGTYVFAKDRDAANHYWQSQQRNLGLDFVDATGFPFYYSFRQNGIFYLVWDASSANIAAPVQAWAERSLASDAAQQAQLRFVVGHLPFYAVSQGRDRPGEVLNRADQLRSQLEQYRVHTYICGHHHAYFPGRAGQLEMLHAGALGSGPRSWLGSIKAAMHTLTLVDIDLATQTTVHTTYNMTTRQVIRPTDLPRLVVGPNGRELRRDLTLADLTPAERTLQHNRTRD